MLQHGCMSMTIGIQSLATTIHQANRATFNRDYQNITRELFNHIETTDRRVLSP